MDVSPTASIENRVLFSITYFDETKLWNAWRAAMATEDTPVASTASLLLVRTHAKATKTEGNGRL
jgi:hypothetical protein